MLTNLNKMIIMIIIIIVNSILEVLKMGYSGSSNGKLMICTGPGCKAWDSEKVLTLVREAIDGDRNIQPCSVSCVNNCGGGVSVGIPDSGKIVKVREPSEVFALLNQNFRTG